MDKRTLLKIKAASLAAESRIIRKEEARQLKRLRAERRNLYESIRRHRIFDLREETRATHVAYGFLRGRDYTAIENAAVSQPAWRRVEAMVQKYGDGEDWERFASWRDDAKNHVDRAQKAYWARGPRVKRIRVANRAPAAVA